MTARTALSVLIAAVLTGCAALQPPAPAQESQPEPEPEAEAPAPDVVATVPPPPKVERSARRSDVELLLDYFQRLRRLSGTDLGREQEGARRAFSRSGSEFDRMRFALTLAQPGASVQDDGQALALLEPLVNNRNSALHALAYLVSAFVQEQRRLGATAQGMQRKLDQLRTMERSLIERGRSGKGGP